MKKRLVPLLKIFENNRIKGKRRGEEVGARIETETDPNSGGHSPKVALIYSGKIKQKRKKKGASNQKKIMYC